MKSIRDICTLAAAGSRELVRLARAGELGPSHLWVAAKGAAVYVAAIADGDVAPPDVVRVRRAACLGCSARTASSEPGAVLGFCGPPLVEVKTPGRESCGCLLDGKIRVGSEACPRGRFAPLTISIAQ